jgi:DNA-binding transcriptional MerR regulator
MHKSYYGTQEVARMLGISKQTLLRYERKRIFPRATRNPINKRREYSPADIEKLKRITGRS